jgi:homocysteine S-methyltransferase
MELGNVENSSTTLMTDFLKKCGGYAVVDGGLATELERHGADLNDPLWSAKCLISSPHLVRRVPSISLTLSKCINKSYAFLCAD